MGQKVPNQIYGAGLFAPFKKTTAIIVSLFTLILIGAFLSNQWITVVIDPIISIFLSSFLSSYIYIYIYLCFFHTKLMNIFSTVSDSKYCSSSPFLQDILSRKLRIILIQQIPIFKNLSIS